MACCRPFKQVSTHYGFFNVSDESVSNEPKWACVPCLLLVALFAVGIGQQLSTASIMCSRDGYCLHEARAKVEQHGRLAGFAIEPFFPIANCANMNILQGSRSGLQVGLSNHIYIMRYIDI